MTKMVNFCMVSLYHDYQGPASVTLCLSFEGLMHLEEGLAIVVDLR